MLSYTIIAYWIFYATIYIGGIPFAFRRYPNLSKFEAMLEYTLGLGFGLLSLLSILVGVAFLMHINQLPTGAWIVTLVVLSCHTFMSVLRVIILHIAGIY